MRRISNTFYSFLRAEDYLVRRGSFSFCKSNQKTLFCNVQKITSAEKLRSRAFDEIVPFRKFIIKDDTSALL